MKVLVSAASRHGSTAEVTTRIADAFVLGSSVYMGRWLGDARRIAERTVTQSQRPVWLFSVGPIGEPAKPAEEPAEIGDLVKATRARDHRLFAGRLDRHQLGLGEKAVVMALRVPEGDFRDWDAITTWAAQIATELSGAVAR